MWTNVSPCRQPISRSGIKLAVITVPTKSSGGAKKVHGGGDHEEEAEAGWAGGAAELAEDGEDAGISLDAPAEVEAYTRPLFQLNVSTFCLTRWLVSLLSVRDRLRLS
jgi:hypothetical protein